MTGSTRRAGVGLAAVLAALLLLLSSCAKATSDGSSSNGVDLGDPGDCTVVDVAVSSEKIDLMNALAKSFNQSDRAKIGDTCVFVRPFSKASGGATDLLREGWTDESEGPQPVIWSPAAPRWG